MKPPTSRSRKSESELEGWAPTWAWISKYLEMKTSPRKIREWHALARRKMELGWTQTQVQERIRSAWREHSLSADERELEDDLKLALAEVYKAADGGWTPAQCAVVYRSLYRIHPSRHWLQDWADAWDKAGNDWQKVVPPRESRNDLTLGRT